MPTPFNSVPVSIPVFMALSTVFHSINSPDNSYFSVPAGSLSRGGDVTVYVYDINQPSLPTPLYSVFVSVFVFVALSIAFHSINSPDTSPVSHSVLPVLSLPC